MLRYIIQSENVEIYIRYGSDIILESNIKEDVLLSEYDKKNQRIADYGESQNTLFLFSFTSIGAILAFSIQQDNPYIALVGFAVLIPIRIRYLYFRNEIFRISAYIRIIITPQLKILNPINTFKDPLIINIQYFSFTYLAGGILLSYFHNNPLNLISLILAIVLTLIVFFIDLYYLIYAKKTYKKFADYWQNQKKNGTV